MHIPLNRFFMFLLLTTVLGGCATANDRRIATLYEAVVPVTGGAGDLYLLQESLAAPTGNLPVQWILGQVLDSEGRKAARVVSDISPDDTVTDALRHELLAAGYKVQNVNAMPAGPVKVLRLKSATVDVTVTPGVSHDKAECQIKMVVEPWLGGVAMSKMTYEARYADVAVVGRSALPGMVMKKALQAVMKRAVPEIVAMLEKRK